MIVFTFSFIGQGFPATFALQLSKVRSIEQPFHTDEIKQYPSIYYTFTLFKWLNKWCSALK